MTAFSPYQAYPGPAPVLTGPPPVYVAVAEPARQRRVTVAFRLLLAFPHLFILYFLFVAAEVVAFIGWWGALFTGRLPEFAGTFLSGVMRWVTRVQAYCLLLTDVYPPFSLDDEPTYPVRVAIPEPQQLNRAAVFFRCFLAFPAAWLGGILIYGACTLMAFIAWLITLCTGQLPPAFHLAYAAVIRFQARYYCYVLMLTPTYPGGLYGDKPGMTAWTDQLPPAPGYGVPGYGVPGYGISGPAYGNPADSAPQGYGTPAPGYAAPAPYGSPGGYGVRPLFQPATWLLPLTSGARALVTTFIALGSVVLAAFIGLYAIGLYAIGNAAAKSTVNPVIAGNQLETSYTTLSNSVDAWHKATTSCDQNLTCVTKQDTKAAALFTTFSSQLARTSVPSASTAAKAKVAADSAAVAQDITQLSKATTVSQYQATLASTGLQQALHTFDTDFAALLNGLGVPTTS